jgi:tRNA-specific 2-thiouridylase
LEIPFFTFDYRETYAEKVLKYMYEWYQKWITPNPDIMCNTEVKFKVFLEEALELWFDYVATGHYARIKSWKLKVESWKEEEIFHLLKWIDETKDQSYFLAWLNQFQLSKTLFPIWNMRKTEVRELALEIWLPNAKRKDSQWICFVWKVDMIKFLEKKINHIPWIVKDTKGKILWKHKWVFYYTIGQRKGLDIWGQKEPIFVVKKDIEKNEIIVWTTKDLELYDNKLFVKEFHFLNSPINPALSEKNGIINFPLKAKAKIRYRQEEQDCIIYKEENRYRVEFKKKQRAITSGQICAIYLGDELIMSGVIT